MWLAPIVLLAIRLWMAEIFFRSGLLKIQDIGSATFLFTEVHPVPLLPPVLAAYIATAVELVASTLLALGLCARLAALPMLAMTLVIQFIVGANDPAFYVTEHYYWMFLLAIVIAVGPGALSAGPLAGATIQPAGVTSVGRSLDRGLLRCLGLADGRCAQRLLLLAAAAGRGRPRDQQQSGMAGQHPRRLDGQRGLAAAAIARILAAPQQPPVPPFRRRQQRLRHDRQLEIDAEIDQQQPVVAFAAHEAQHEGLLAQDRAVHATAAGWRHARPGRRGAAAAGRGAAPAIRRGAPAPPSRACRRRRWRRRPGAG